MLLDILLLKTLLPMLPAGRAYLLHASVWLHSMPLTLCSVQLQGQPILGRTLLPQAFQQLLLLLHSLRHLLIPMTELFLNTTMELACFLQLLKYI